MTSIDQAFVAPVANRRQFLKLAGGLGLAAPLLSACGGLSTSGSGGSKDGVALYLTQFTPVNQSDSIRSIVKSVYDGPANVIVGDASQMPSQVRPQVDAGDTKIDLLGGLHGDFATLGEKYLEDLSDVASTLADRGFSKEFLSLASLGTDKTYYIPWCQATYVMAANKSAVAELPSGAKPESLTYDQLLDWAIALRKSNKNKPLFGLPAGPKSLLHRFIQGYLYPSFTGGMMTGFRSPEAVEMWKYLKELWANTAPASTNYDFMQEPLSSGEVTVAWDHVSRLVDAPKEEPDQWTMFAGPSGPKARGYMAVVLGLGLVKGSKRAEQAKELIKGLSSDEAQIEVLKQDAFFPATKTQIPTDLSPAIQLEATAVAAQQGSYGTPKTALPPVGLGQKDGELTKVFLDSFRSIILENRDIQNTLDAQAKIAQSILDAGKTPCWAPDPVEPGVVCKVG